MAWLPNNDNHLLRPLPCQETSKAGNQSCHSSHLSPRSNGSPKWGQSESCRRKARHHLLRREILLLSSALSKISIHRRSVLSLISFLAKVEGRVREDKAKVVVGRRDITRYGEKSFSSPLPCQEESKIDNLSCHLSHLIPILRKERSVKGSRGDGDEGERRQRTLFIAYSTHIPSKRSDRRRKRSISNSTREKERGRRREGRRKRSKEGGEKKAVSNS